MLANFRFPDIPSREIHPSFLEQMKEGEWIATLKLDGWRCLVEAKDGTFTYRSRVGKPIILPDKVRIPFEEFVTNFQKTMPLDVIMDCELTGNRRSGDAQAIFILDLLRCSGVDYYSSTLMDRLRGLDGILLDMLKVELWDGYSYRTPWASRNFRHFWDLHKAEWPLAEGIVFKRPDSKYIGSTKEAAKNPGWVKCKWRAGQDGLSPNE